MGGKANPGFADAKQKNKKQKAGCAKALQESSQNSQESRLILALRGGH